MDITASNAVVMLSVAGLFDIPQQLQQFSADNIFGTDPLEAAETAMGVDGVLTGGQVFNPTNQSYELMADSPSNFFFDQLYLRQRADQVTYRVQGTVLLTSVGTKWTMRRGILVTYQPLPEARRVLQARRHTIRWERVTPNPS
jgi:hypothetical protein